MNIVFLTHSSFFESQSMPRFARMLTEGMKKRGHKVELWSPKALLYRLSAPAGTKKWLGYIDQYLLFPEEVRKRKRKQPQETLYVFTDQALGPWVPLVANRPHVIHCHDFLAQRSALGKIPENRTTWTGRQYQAYIRRGYSTGKNFVSVSQKTKEDLHAFLPKREVFSEVVYNGLNQSFSSSGIVDARIQLGKKTNLDLKDGYLLHVGGNQWYKNRVGVIEIYNAWRKAGTLRLPLLMVGKVPNVSLKQKFEQSTYNSDIYFLSGLEDEFVKAAYAGASLFIFPSLAEGFGWPIAEAMASGCPVITTNEAPMTEVGDNAAYYIPKRPSNNTAIIAWAEDAAKVVDKILLISPLERERIVKAGLVNAKRFDTEVALNRIEAIYKKVLQSEKSL